MAGQFRENWKRLANKQVPVTLPTAVEDKDIVRVEDVDGLVNLNPANGDIIVGSGTQWTKLSVGASGLVLRSDGVTPFWGVDASGAAGGSVGNVVTFASGTGASSGVLTNTTQVFFAQSGVTSVFLPASPVPGQRHDIKDIDGQAGTTPIVIEGNGNTIDGSATTSLVNDYGAATLILGPTEWNIL